MSAKKRRCVVPGCDNNSHAKGYCRKHYGQIWRKGKIYTLTNEEEPLQRSSAINRDDADRVRALERELRRARMMYNNVVGVAGRLKWRGEIEEVCKEMKRFGLDPNRVKSDDEAFK